MNCTPATAATRVGPRTVGGGAAAGFTRRGSVFTVAGQEDNLELDDAWHWQDEEKEYEHIMTILDRQGGFGQTHSDPAFYVCFPTLEERRAAHNEFSRKCNSSSTLPKGIADRFLPAKIEAARVAN